MITLKTLKYATAQEVFDQVAEHLLAQKQQSLDPDKYNDICVPVGTHECDAASQEY